MSKRSKPRQARQPYQPSFETGSSAESCQMCPNYEEDIAILQEKLMDTHNKLIEQLDICREQQLQIIEYKQQISKFSHINTGDNLEGRHNGTNKSAGKIIGRHHRNSGECQHCLQPLLQTKNQLLKNDLQAMRKKVLSEIQKTNLLKDNIKKQEQRHQQEIDEYRDRIKQLQISRNELEEENDALFRQCEAYKQSEKKQKICECGFEKKYYELEQAFMNQRNLTSQLIEENNQLETKLYEQKERMAQHGSEQALRAGDMNIQIAKRNKTKHNQRRRLEFETTRSLMDRLEQAERQTRNKK